MSLLRVTSSGAGHATVKVWADEVSFLPPAGSAYDRQLHSITAMSLIGPEQAIRAIAAGCALDNPYSRVLLTFDGGGDSGRRLLVGRWNWPWPDVRAVLLATGALHLVSIGRGAKVVGGNSHMVIPAENTDEGLVAAIYECLLKNYSTPMIPCDRTGQPAFERLSAKLWRKWIVAEVMRDGAAWTPCIPHPEQPERNWIRAGVLSVSQEHLDAIVTRLIQTRRLSIPTPPQEVVA